MRANGARFFDHPGPDQIRARRIRHYLVVTDFIGSGQRACDNLEAVWQIRSVKSWSSYGWLKFGIVAFSGTAKGLNAVARHASGPTLHLHAGCPVVDDLPRPQRNRIIDLCSRYGPVLRRSSTDRTPLGYGGSGALISFDHGMPNNAPLLLHTKTRNWTPLFPRRSGALLRDARQAAARPAEIERRLTRLRERRLAQSPRFAGIAEDQQNRILLLTALKRRPRTPVILSARTGLPVAEVEALIARAQLDGFVDGSLRLTEAAYNALEYLRRSDAPKRPLPETDESHYCPEYLRPPRRVV